MYPIGITYVIKYSPMFHVKRSAVESEDMNMERTELKYKEKVQKRVVVVMEQFNKNYLNPSEKVFMAMDLLSGIESLIELLWGMNRISSYEYYIYDRYFHIVKNHIFNEYCN